MNQKSENEKDLVALARKGDQEAFSRLLSSLEPRLFRVALLLTGERETARDLLQETFIGLYRGLPGFLGRSSLYTYGYRILVNQYYKRTRAQARDIRAEPEVLQKIPAPGPSPAEIFRQDEKTAGIRKAVARLPEKFRTVIILRYLEELSYTEIAEQLRTNEGTVKSRLFKARILLMDSLKNEPI